MVSQSFLIGTGYAERNLFAVVCTYVNNYDNVDYSIKGVAIEKETNKHNLRRSRLKWSFTSLHWLLYICTVTMCPGLARKVLDFVG